MNANEEMAKLEAETNWEEMVSSALSSAPSDWSGLAALYWRWKQWGYLFQVIYGGMPLKPDFPCVMNRFFYLLASANIPPTVINWADDFKRENGRMPKLEELPAELRSQVPTNKRGRPRKDTAHMRAIAKEWRRMILTESYEMRRDALKFEGPYLSSCFGYSPVDIKDESPSRLALEKLHDETGYSVDYLKDIIQRP